MILFELVGLSFSLVETVGLFLITYAIKPIFFCSNENLEFNTFFHFFLSKIFLLFLDFKYRLLLKKSGLKTPRIELEEIGPSFDFSLRRTHLASESLFKDSLRRPKMNKVCYFRFVVSNYFFWGLFSFVPYFLLHSSMRDCRINEISIN